MPFFQQTLYGREINGSSSSVTDLPDGENGYGKTATSHVDATSLTGGAVADDQKERIREEYEIRKAEESARNMENTQKLQQAAEESRKGAERFREEHFGPEKVKGDYGFRQISQRGYEGSGIKNSSDPYNPQYRHKYRTTETTKQGTGYFSGFASEVSQTQDSSKRT